MRPQAYIVNDIYLKYINLRLPTGEPFTMNYITGIVVVAVELFSPHPQTSMMCCSGLCRGLYGGYVAANCLGKWYWWRFNASRFF